MGEIADQKLAMTDSFRIFGGIFLPIYLFHRSVVR